MTIIYLKSEEDLKKIISNPSVLVIIDCYADWCGPCKVLGESLKVMSNKWSDLYGNRIKVCKLNVDNDKFANFVELNKIESLPTVLFAKGDNIIKKIIGCKVADITNFVSEIMSVNEHR